VKARPVDVAVDPRLSSTVGSAQSLIPRGLRHLQWATQWDSSNALRHRSVALYVLSYVEEEPKRSQLAAAAYRRALELEPKVLGRVVDDLKTRRADAGLLREAVPRRFDLVLDVARHLATDAPPRAASLAFEEALALAANPVEQREARLAYARGMLQAKDPGAALVQARHALVLDPKNAEVFAMLGDAYDGLRQFAEAEAAYSSAVAVSEGLDPRRRSEHGAKLAGFLTRRGESARALATWRQLLRQTPDDPWTHLELARFLQRQQEGSEAFLEYQAAHRLGAQDPDLQRAVAEDFTRGGHPREATAALEIAVSLRPSDLPARLELADLYARTERPDQAMEQYRQVLARQPGNEAARRGVARLTGPAGRPSS
jgi:Tfp pilus assembly protein PilF